MITLIGKRKMKIERFLGPPGGSEQTNLIYISQRWFWFLGPEIKKRPVWFLKQSRPEVAGTVGSKEVCPDFIPFQFFFQ